MARKPGTTSTTTKRGAARRKSTATAKSTGARTRSRKATEDNGSDELKTTPATATRKRQPKAAQSRATSKQGSSREQQALASTSKSNSSTSGERGARNSKLRSVLGSPMVRNVVAAGLASAAAAILYRKPKGSTAEDQSVSEASTELMPGEVETAPAKTNTATRVRRKAACGAENVTSTVKAAASKARGRRKASADIADPVAAADPTETAPNLIEQPKRKRRSDAGTKRTLRKTRADVGAPSGIEPTAVDVPASLDQMKTSAFAFSNEPTTEAAPATNTADEQLAEAHPS